MSLVSVTLGFENYFPGNFINVERSVYSSYVCLAIPYRSQTCCIEHRYLVKAKKVTVRILLRLMDMMTVIDVRQKDAILRIYYVII